MLKYDSEGERLIHNRLIRDKGSKDYFVLHSLFISKHLTQKTGELDFVIMVPNKGIFCIEVKHGGVERTSDGTWRFTNRLGKTNENKKGPFRQVSDSMNSLIKLVNDLTQNKPELQQRFSKLLFGYGVMFTSMDYFDNYGVGEEPWQLFLRPDFKNDISYYFDNLSRQWHDKYSNLSTSRFWYNDRTSRPTIEDCELLKKTLRGDFSYDYSIINRINDEETCIDEFTKDQFDILDFANENFRCLIEGGAGTGKSVMAMELARRKSEEGLKVALFCYNSLLGSSLDKNMILLNHGYNEKSFAGTLSKFMLTKTNVEVPTNEDDLNDFFSTKLPNEFRLVFDELADNEKFDYLVIDESQDLLTPEYIDVLDSLLKGGIKDGKWTLFGDFSNQAIYKNNPDESLNLLTATANYVKFPRLKYNCRNSKIIAETNTLVTGCEKLLMKADMPEGEPNYIQFFNNLSDIKTSVESVIKDLEAKGIPLSKVTLLSPIKIGSTGLDYSDFIKKAIDERGLTFHTIHSYKGLENSYIIITGFNEINSPLALRLMYVAISRARFKLYMILSESLKSQYINHIEKNFPNSKLL